MNESIATGAQLVDQQAATAQPDALAASHRYCARLARLKAKNFYYGLKLTPQPKRAAMYAVYAWMRAADDIIDEPGDPADKARALDLFRAMTRAAYRPSHEPPPAIDNPPPGPFREHAPMWPAVHSVIRRHRIDQHHLDEMIQGQLLDQGVAHYQTFAQLYDYCYKVASTVGLVCITVWGCEGGTEASKLAEERGVALQLTNIIRDVVEDAERGRVYIPADELRQAGYASSDEFMHAMRRRAGDERFDRLMKRQIARAEQYYQRALPLDRLIDKPCRPTAWALMHIYHLLLAKIAADPRAVLDGRVALSRWTKITVMLRAAWGRRGF